MKSSKISNSEPPMPAVPESLPYYQQPPPILIAPAVVGEAPSMVICQNCHSNVTTTVSKKTGALPWIACLAICGVGIFLPCLWLGCCFIPFCVSDLKDVVHTCPNCKAYIGTYKRM